MELTNKVVVVTGGGNGIGREVVLGLLRRGARVAAIDIRKDSLEETADLAAARDSLALFETDITDREAVEALPAQIEAALGPVDGLIHVAGIIQPFVRLKDLEYEDIDKVIAVNLWGTIYLNKTFLPGLLERPSAYIANVSSMGGFLPVPGQTIYGATKAAVKLMTEGLYAELLDTNVGVSVIMPGAVATDITSNSGVEVQTGAVDQGASFPTTPAPEAARIILDGIEGEELHIYVGKDARMMGLLNRAAPKRSTHLIHRQMKGLLPP